MRSCDFGNARIVGRLEYRLANHQAMAQQPQTVTREYQHELMLKYGCNPHQKPASIWGVKG